MSITPFVSGVPGSRLVAAEANATQRPSALIDGATLGPSAWTPPGPTLTRVVVSVVRLYTNTSEVLFVSSGTKLVATEWNATKLQLLSTLVKELPPSAGAPPNPPLTNSVVELLRSRTKTSVRPLVSCGT